MKTFTFAFRTLKEIIRDPLTLIFGLGFPAVLLLLLSAIQANIPVSMFEIGRLAPAMTVFGLSFITLFSSFLIAKDRESAFLERLYTTPMTATNFILGYSLPLFLVAFIQVVFCFIIGIVLGLKITVNLLLCLALSLPISIFFIALGLLFGSILTQKQVGGICGALLTNLSAWLSGIWFDIKLVGGAFEFIAKLLPFYHAVELQTSIYAKGTINITNLLVVLGYAIAFLLIAILLFVRQMKKN
ncbi:MAG: ABC transporter permease [Clostridia bacterium]|nr:ABC transporter permease [Clostridia bacterium]